MTMASAIQLAGTWHVTVYRQCTGSVSSVIVD